jgi:hypothetical protein
VSNALSDRFGASCEEVGTPVEEARCVSSICNPTPGTGEGEVVRCIDTWLTWLEEVAWRIGVVKKAKREKLSRNEIP